MTAQEKANDLIKFFDSIQFDHDKNIAYTFAHFTIEEKKRCAMHVVDEIIDAIDWHEFETPNLQMWFWDAVKKEIQKL